MEISLHQVSGMNGLSGARAYFIPLKATMTCPGVSTAKAYRLCAPNATQSSKKDNLKMTMRYATINRVDEAARNNLKSEEKHARIMAGLRRKNFETDLEIARVAGEVESFCIKRLMDIGLCRNA